MCLRKLSLGKSSTAVQKEKLKGSRKKEREEQMRQWDEDLQKEEKPDCFYSPFHKHFK